MRDKPYIASEQSLAELTVKGVLLAALLTAILAMSNAFLALKLGILTSASIPAAIISMGVLRLFRHSTILENNAVQTAASAGEAVAGGIVYTIPALIIIGYWHHFDYWTNFFIAALGGVLGVLFSIPLRRILVHETSLRFPEGRAIAEVLKTSAERAGLRDLLLGGLLGSLLELLQAGFKLLAGSFSFWFSAQRSLFGFGGGFSATMIGAGFLVGEEMALCIFFGALLSWGLLLPLISYFYPQFGHQYPAGQAVTYLWNSQMRYLGIGAMLFSGTWTFLGLLKPLMRNMRLSWRDFIQRSAHQTAISRVEKDIPLPYLLLGLGATAALLFLVFQQILPVERIGFSAEFTPSFVFATVLYVLVIGFLFSVITAYFSGMVGVTASPGSSIVIAGMLFAAWILLTTVYNLVGDQLSASQIQAAEAITIVIGSVVTGIAAIANDNTQDLKVGQLVGATPWKQQLMLLFGVMISALVIPPVMQLLFDVYGIAGVMPRPDMDPALSLPAPVAAMMAAVTEAVFRHSLPWNMMLIGALLMALILIVSHGSGLQKRFKVSILGVAIGMYLPLASSFPLFLGGLIAWLVKSRIQGLALPAKEAQLRTQRGVLIACGLVAGSALLDVILAIPFSMMKSPDALSLVGPGWQPYGLSLSVVAIVLLGRWILWRVSR